MNSLNNEIEALIDIAIGYAKDQAIEDVLSRVSEAQRDFLLSEADARRTKNNEIICSIVRLDAESKKLEITYSSMKDTLTVDARDAIEIVLSAIKKQRKTLVLKKRKLSGSIYGTSQYSIGTSENINGIPLSPGDVLAVTRKGGLYQHYAVYIGNNRVIHYAAEQGDFAGKITIHEAPIEEFKAGSLLIYVLDFPKEAELPKHRGDKETQINEDSFFNMIREQHYHLYSPEETISRAKSRLGEEKYALPFNNCEHFAIWCKTGIKESHQVNEWLTKIYQVSKKVKL